MDEEEYINIENLLNNDKEKIFQLQLNNDEITIKEIGSIIKNEECPDIIIENKIGKNIKLFNCIYKEDELFKFKDLNNLFPIIKLVKDDLLIYSFAIKFNDIIQLNTKYTNFDLFFTYYQKNKEFINKIKIQKTINSQNIIELLLQNIIDAGHIIIQ